MRAWLWCLFGHSLLNFVVVLCTRPAILCFFFVCVVFLLHLRSKDVVFLLLNGKAVAYLPTSAWLPSTLDCWVGSKVNVNLKTHLRFPLVATTPYGSATKNSAVPPTFNSAHDTATENSVIHLTPCRNACCGNFLVKIESTSNFCCSPILCTMPIFKVLPLYLRYIQYVCSKMGYVKISQCVKCGMLISSCWEKAIKLRSGGN